MCDVCVFSQAEAAREEARTLKQSLAETKMSLANAETALAETRAANEQLNAKVIFVLGCAFVCLCMCALLRFFVPSFRAHPIYI